MPRPAAFSVISAVPLADSIDECLLKKIADGDDGAFAALYLQTHARLLSIATIILCDRFEAEDVVQEVFVVVWNKAALFDGSREGAYPWIASITRNRAIDSYRCRTRRSSASEPLLAQAFLTDDRVGGPHETDSMNSDDYRVIRCAVATLPTKMRDVIELTFFQRLTHAEAARRLKEPLGTVKARARRALVRLRLLLQQVGFEHAERTEARRDRPASRTAGSATCAPTPENESPDVATAFALPSGATAVAVG